LLLMLIQILSILLDVVWWFIVAQAIMSWLFAFNVINTSNEFVTQIWRVLDRITEPLYRPFRRIMPDFGGLDLTPMVVLILIVILRGPVLSYLARFAYANGLA
jgi:YggT family protein